jgi:F-type H+-transporting ATPase subunit a
VAAGGSSIDALGQFKLHTALGPIGHAVNFTQSNLFMVIAGLLTLALLWYGMRPRALVPGRFQAAAEMVYDAWMSICIEQIGPEGRKYFPFIFTLFFFILLGNLLGIWPYNFTFTSHIMVTLALALFVVVMATVVGLRRHGMHFFSYFLPAGVPLWLAPLLVPIEILSYLSRIISLSVRLFANMMAGHVMLEVFGAFVVMLGGGAMLGGLHALDFIPAAVSFLVDTALIGFELLVGFLQAYVFAMLTCIYLHDAEHLH